MGGNPRRGEGNKNPDGKNPSSPLGLTGDRILRYGEAGGKGGEIEAAFEECAK